jgi:hypothetical protein
MPTDWHFQDAYWLVEYVSLEDREAAAFRQADLQIPFEQHVALTPQNTAGGRNVRQRLGVGGLVRDLIWTLQPEDAETYNAYFYYGKQLRKELDVRGDLPIGNFKQCIVNFQSMTPPDWEYGSGYIIPAFHDEIQDPLAAARMLIRGRERFNLDSPALMRSLIPALNYRSVPYFSRFVYRYTFGFWPSGGLANAMVMAEDEVRGAANWDKLPERELVLTLENDYARVGTWEDDPTQSPIVFEGGDLLVNLDASFNPFTPGYRFFLGGGQRSSSIRSGDGAYVNGYVDLQTVRTLSGYTGTYLRLVANGSASIVSEHGPSTAQKYIWLAVAGAGGGGGSNFGGNAGNAVTIGNAGGTVSGGGAATHVGTVSYGGGGGGRLSAAGVGLGVAMGDTGQWMETLTTPAFVKTLPLTQTGGVQRGGDGYYGGGGGNFGGGGGGSHVSQYVSSVASAVRTPSSSNGAPFVSPPADVAPYAYLIPQRRVQTKTQSYNLYTWVTRYNMLRVTGGRGVIMFSE